jgi:DNA-binding HxlR family transcriptional regulator
MQTYAQYCPISRSLDIVGDRWSLLVIRELIIGSTRFNEIARGLPGLSRGLLSRRLRQLEGAGIVEREDGAYRLTSAGEDLQTLVMQLADWGARHAFGPPREEELDPDLLMWWMHDRVDTQEITTRTVVEIHMTDVRRHYWLVLEPADASICFTDPGFEVEALLRGDLSMLYQVWLGHPDLRTALRRGDLTLTGQQTVVRGLPRWLSLSPVAPIVAAARAEEAVGAGARSR